MAGDWRNKLLVGDCAKVLCEVPEAAVDLVITSPPYADQRKKTYGGVPIDEYVKWFLPITRQLHRVLSPRGSFVLNIKERVAEGERHTYVLELILAMRKQGWLWTEEYIWHKKNCHPGKWPNRFRDAWERCLHFTKQRGFAMYQEAVRVPMGEWRHARLKNLSETDRRRDDSRVKSGFGKKIENWIGRELAYPSNVLHLATECGNQSHSATFPVALPSWFIQLFTKAGDVVLDPFMGSGTTALAAKKLGRAYLGVELQPEYVELAQRRLRLAVSGREGNQDDPQDVDGNGADAGGRVRRRRAKHGAKHGARHGAKNRAATASDAAANGGLFGDEFDIHDSAA